MRSTIILSICYFLLVSVAIASDQTPAKLGHQINKLSQPFNAPDFDLQNMDEDSFSLKDFQGKVLLINFWATWCPPCRHELPSMENLFQTMKDTEFKIIAINQLESPDHVFSYMGELGTDLNFPILFDLEGTVSKAYKVTGIPTTYLVDKLGKIRYRAVGGREFDHPGVEKIIRDLLAE